jgi:hypothetical protein
VPDELDRETEALLAGLLDGGDPDPPRRGLTELLDGLDDGDEPAPPPPDAFGPQVPRPPSRPDRPTVPVGRPASEERPRTRQLETLDGEPVPARQPLDDEPAFPATAAHTDPDAAAAALAALTEPEMTAEVRAPRRESRTLLWVGLISFAVAGLAAVLYTQTDAFHPERGETRARLSAQDKERALARHRAEQPVAGTLTIEANEEEAAVWLLLGRTPLESFQVPSGQVHAIRYELEDHHSVDATIARPAWRGEGDGLRAEHEARLVPGRREAPAFPPEEAVRPPPGPKGKGPLSLSSDPPGARVWLLIGFTPRVVLGGLEAGRSYQVKVLKVGFHPAFASVTAEDWMMAGGEVRAEVTLRPSAAR